MSSKYLVLDLHSNDLFDDDKFVYVLADTSFISKLQGMHDDMSMLTSGFSYAVSTDHLSAFLSDSPLHFVSDNGQSLDDKELHCRHNNLVCGHVEIANEHHIESVHFSLKIKNNLTFLVTISFGFKGCEPKYCETNEFSLSDLKGIEAETFIDLSCN